MTKAMNMWRAQRVRRWHCNPDLSETSDFIDGHSARVAKLILALGDGEASRQLIIAALIHDDGEHAVGDIAQPVKSWLRLNKPDTWAQIEAVEASALDATWSGAAVNCPSLDEAEGRWLKFADRLDAFIWAATHGARMDRNGWPEDRAWLRAESCWLGCEDAVWAMLDDVNPPPQEAR